MAIVLFFCLRYGRTGACPVFLAASQFSYASWGLIIDWFYHAKAKDLGWLLVKS